MCDGRLGSFSSKDPSFVLLNIGEGEVIRPVRMEDPNPALTRVMKLRAPALTHLVCGLRVDPLVVGALLRMPAILGVDHFRG